MRRGGAAVLAGITFVLVALVAGAMTDAFIRDVDAHASAVRASTAASTADDTSSNLDTVSSELTRLFDLERGAASEVWTLTRHSRAFGYTLAGKVALLVGLGLFWMATRVRGRSLRVLNGVGRHRIQAEDLMGFASSVVLAATIVGAAASVVAALTAGTRFLSFFVRTYSVVAAAVITVTMVLVVVVSLLTLPSHHLIAERRPTMTGLLRATRVARLVAFGLVILAMGPAIAVATRSGSPALPPLDPDSLRGLSEGEIAAVRYARYELWIATAAVSSLLIALLISSVLGAYISALSHARRDFAARLNGEGWWKVGLVTSHTDQLAKVVVAIALIAFIPSHLTVAHVSGATMLLVTAIFGGLVAQAAARRQVFAQLAERKV